MGGGVFTYIVDLANELVNSYDMYIAYAVRKQTPENYKDYFDKRIHLIEVKNFGRAIDPAKDIAAFFEVKKIAAKIKPDVIHLHSSKAGTIGRVAFNGKIPMFYTPHGYSFLMENYKPMKRRMFKVIESVCAKKKAIYTAIEKIAAPFCEKIICKELGKPEILITHVGDRKSHDMRYAIDQTKIHNELGWLPETKFEDGIKKTIQWYLDNREWWETIISGEYQNYYEKMYSNR